MSTRCNVIVNNGTCVEQYYHHFDGYLSGVGNELFESVQKGFYKGLETYGGYEKEELGLHGDIEYLYYVNLVTNKVYYNRLGHTEICGEVLGWKNSIDTLNALIDFAIPSLLEKISEVFIEMTEVAND